MGCLIKQEEFLVETQASPGTTNVIQYITIAQTGTRNDFGELDRR